MRLPIPLLVAGFLLLGTGCVYTRTVAPAPATPDFYTFGPPVEVSWTYGCALPACGYPVRWAGNRWVYWTGTYWAFEEAGRVYAWTHVRSRPAGVRYTRPRNVVVVDPRYAPAYPPPVQRPPPYRPPSAPQVQRPRPYQPGQQSRDDVPPPNRGSQRPTPRQPSQGGNVPPPNH